MADRDIIGEIANAEYDARSAILQKIPELVPSAKTVAVALSLAEAYAWVMAPNQNHGGSGSSG